MFQRLLPEAPERCVEAYYLQRTREHRRAGAGPEAVDRGREGGDQRAGGAESIGENPADREERLKLDPLRTIRSDR